MAIALFADSATKLVSVRNIAGVAFDGTNSITIPFANIDGLTTALAGKQATLIAGKGIFFNPTNSINSLWQYPDVFVSLASVNTSERVRIGSLVEGSALLHLTGSATNGGTLRSEYVGNTPNFELIRVTGTASTNYNWNILNDNSFKLQSKNLVLEYTDKLEISGSGDVGINTTTNTLYKLNVGGDVNITGNYRVKGNLFKPAGAVLTDTATKVETIRTTAGSDFDGTVNINIDYFALNNKPITLLPATTNLQIGTTYNLIVGSVASGTIERLSVGGNIRATGNISAETNFTVTGFANFAKVARKRRI